jgi:IclR family acetate operon transcriptional repressor
VPPDTENRVVGADRVLAVLIELANHPEGVGLEDLAGRMRSSKSTVHRALSALRNAGLAAQPIRGKYVLGDDFLRLAFRFHAQRPESVRIEPALRALATRFGETAHYAVLDGREVVYRAKVDPPTGAVALTSVVGGRNPLHSTAVGKMLLAYEVESVQQLEDFLRDWPLEARTPNTVTTPAKLWAQLRRIRERDYATDDQENEVGINCVAVPIRRDVGLAPVGAVSVSAVAFRTPLSYLEDEITTIRQIVAGDVQGPSR